MQATQKILFSFNSHVRMSLYHCKALGQKYQQQEQKVKQKRKFVWKITSL